MSKITKTRRQEIIYQLLKGHDIESGLTATEIHQQMESEGLDVDLRTIRRDLTELTTTHGLSSNESRPERYFPSKNYSLKYELHLNENTLQVLLIALNNLKFTSHDYFKSFATETETAIFESLDPKVANDLRKSKDKYYFDFSTAGKPISSNSKDFEKVMVAIRENKIITCNNNSPYHDDEYNQRRRRFAPYMFILTSGIPYIIVEDQDDRQFKKLRATRISDVRLSKKSFEPIHFKDYLHLENFVGGWGGLQEETTSIKIICDGFMATYFKERTIHNSQEVMKLSEDKFQLTFNCSHSYELVRLFSSFGGHIKSIEPLSLYSQIKEIWRSGLKKAA